MKTLLNGLLAIGLLSFVVSAKAQDRVLNVEEHCSISEEGQDTEMAGTSVDLVVVDCKAEFQVSTTEAYKALRNRCLIEVRRRGATIQTTDIIRMFIDDDGTDATMICGIYKGSS